MAKSSAEVWHSYECAICAGGGALLRRPAYGACTVAVTWHQYPHLDRMLIRDAGTPSVAAT
jgi:hypothetical protein